jgi:hypothetical protein
MDGYDATVPYPDSNSILGDRDFNSPPSGLVFQNTNTGTYKTIIILVYEFSE